MIDLRWGDCLEVMKTIPDGSVDLVVTDPPYEFKPGGFGGGQKEISKRKLKQDINNNLFNQEFDTLTLMSEFKRILKKMNVVVFGTEKMMNKLMNYCEDNGYTYTLTVWHKTNPTPLCNNRYLNSIEFAIHIREKGVKIYGSYHTKGKVYTSQVNKKDKDKYNHPTIKPLELVRKYIINHSLENDTVLDCFMGSGTTGVACKELNRNFIGIELDENYFNIAKNRIENTESPNKWNDLD